MNSLLLAVKQNLGDPRRGLDGVEGNGRGTEGAKRIQALRKNQKVIYTVKVLFDLYGN